MLEPEFNLVAIGPVMAEQQSGISVKPGQLLSRRAIKRLFESCAPAAHVPASALYLRPGHGRQFLDSQGPEGREWRERLSGMDRSILDSDTGLAALRSGSQGLVILPPFPLAEESISPSWDPGPLLALLETEYTIGVILLRLGRFSVAVFQGRRLLTAKTDARYVKGRHAAGGTSQKRYQRIREGQVRRLYDKTCQAVQTQFGSIAKDVDFVLLGGDRFTLDGFLKVCPYLERQREKILDRRLNIRDPKRDTLEEAAEMLSQCRVYPLEW